MATVSSLADLWTWWVAQIRPLVPGDFLNVDSSDAERLVFADDGDAYQVRRGRAGVESALGRLGEEAGAEPLRAELAQLQPPRFLIDVLLPAGKVLRKELLLPEAARPELAQVIEFEMERQTPFAVEQVLYSYEALDRRAGGQFAVQLNVVPRRVLAPILDLWPQHELGLTGVSPHPEGMVLRLRDNAGNGGRTLSWRRWLWLVNALLLIAVVALPFQQQAGELARLESEVDKARRMAEAAQGQQLALEAYLRQRDFLLSARDRVPSGLVILRELTESLPDSTWLNRLQIKNGKVFLNGASGAASSLAGILEGSVLFGSARFVSPITQQPGTDKESFQLEAKIVSAGEAS